MYQNPDRSDKNCYCLLTVMTKVQFVDGMASFLLVGDVNAHHEKGLGSSTTNFHGRAVRNI